MEQIKVEDIVKGCGGTLLCGDPGQEIDHISIDSRKMKGNDLFVPLIGERTDAHLFIPNAFAAGAKAVLTSERLPKEEELRYAWIKVEDTRKALQMIGSWYRSRLSLPLIGITGSVGKTTTREMIAAALSARYQVYQTPGNSNSQVGVPITISEIRAEDEIGVIELGVSEPGEMSRIARIARVHQAVMTNIGVAHIGQLGSQEGICEEKLHIQDGMEEGGILYVNGDDPILRTVEAKNGCRTVTYGTENYCDYQAVGIGSSEDGYPVFTALCHETGEFAKVKLKVYGYHMITNAMVALAVARENKIPMEKAAEALEQFTGCAGRQQIHKIKGITIIDDSYNASPVSMKAGITVLQDMPSKGRKIAVLADMKELGEDSRRYHQEIGQFLRGRGLDYVLLLGELASEIGKPLAQEKETSVLYFEEKDKLADWLKTRLESGDCVLVKGSNSMGLGKVTADLTASLNGR